MANQAVLWSVALFIAAGPIMTESATAQLTARPDVMTGAFEPGFVGEAFGERFPMRVVRLGEMEIASGQVVVADPAWMWTSDRPIALSVAPGRYAVDLAVADTGDSGQRIALARLRLSSEPAVRWAMAVTETQDVSSLEPGQIFGYGVDTGTGAFIDAGSLVELAAANPDQYGDWRMDQWNDWTRQAETTAVQLGIPYGHTLITRLGTGDIAFFSSGWGDGFYASWVGYDAADRPVAIVTDFAVITAVNAPADQDEVVAVQGHAD